MPSHIEAVATRPLRHLRVVELTVNMPGPFCATILADLGASVIKVEPPGGDPLRFSPGAFAAVNRGKQSIVLDLKVAGAQNVARRLADSADIVLEGWRPGVAQRLGVDYATLAKGHPGLVYCSISGFGNESPWRSRPAHDLNYLALAGYLGLQSLVEGRPWPPPVLIADVSAGLYAAVAVLAAVTGRQLSGHGAYIDLSMLDSVVALLGSEIGHAAATGMPQVDPNVTILPHYGLFRCADGRWLSFAIVHEERFWRRFCEAIDHADLAALSLSERIERRVELRAMLTAIFETAPAAEWEQRLLPLDLPLAVVANLEELAASPHFIERGLLCERDGYQFVGQPMRFSTGSVAPTSGPPDLGEHSTTILADIGLSTAEIEALGRNRALG